MKTEIEIVTGFLGSGKTKFINALLKNTLVNKERVLVIQWEQGEEVIDRVKGKNIELIIKELDPQQSLEPTYIQRLLTLYNPHRLIIEHNGTRSIEELSTVLNDVRLADVSYVGSIFHMTDALTFDAYLQNMGNMLKGQIVCSDLIIVYNSVSTGNQNKEKVINNLRKLNSKAYILEIKDLGTMAEELSKANILDKGLLKKIRLLIKNFI